MNIQSSMMQANPHFDGAALGWRYSAITRAKADFDGLPNDDAWLVHQGPAHLDVVVIDVATHKRRVLGSEIQNAIADTFVAATAHAGPAEIIAAAHFRLTTLLRERDARGVACLLIVRLLADGRCEWAHVGDTVLIRWQSAKWWRRSILRPLNTRHRRGHGLTQCVGSERKGGPLIEEGCVVATPGERLLLASDGVFHDAITLRAIHQWVDAHHRQRDVLLPRDLAEKIEAEARMTQPDADDTTLIVIERMTRRTPPC